MHVDLRALPVGRLLGGDLHRVELCPRCRLPGAQRKSKRSVFVHSFDIANDAVSSSATFEVLDACALTSQSMAALSVARRMHAKPTT